MAAQAPLPYDPATQNIFGLTQWDPSKWQVNGQTQFFDLDKPLLSHAFGWLVIAGFSAIFAVLAVFFVWAEKRVSRGYRIESAEQFNTAGRRVGTGLIATDIVSHWTFPSVLLSSVTYGYLFGVGAAMWTSTSGVVVVWLFAILAIELKYKAPTAHTFLEVIMCRWGRWAHGVFYFVGVATNLLVSINMLQGAVVVINALTGINIYAVCFVIPFGIAAYGITGGLKSTFVTSWIHTAIIFGVLILFYCKTFFTGSALGSIDLVYERLQQVPLYFPVSGNKGGSLLTAWSDPGLQLAVITTITGFSQLVTDQSYWQSAVAASPSKAARGYVLGSLFYGAIMFSLPMCIGLAVWALDLPVSANEVSNGLAFPATAYALCGRAGLYLTVVICFMSVTSCGAGEMVAVSSLLTFSGYRLWRPNASNKELVLCSRIGIVLWAAVMGVAQTVVYVAGIPVYLTGLVISVVLGSGVPPVVLVLTWRRCTGLAASLGAILGSACGTTAWIVYTKIKLGSVTATNLSANYALLTGSVVSLGVSILLCVAVSFLRPEKELFRWERLKEEITMTDEDITGFQPDGPDSMAHLARTRKYVWSIGIGAFFFLVVGWPLLTLPAGIWSLGYFKLMVWLFFLLLLFGAATSTFYPIIESRASIWAALTLRQVDQGASALPLSAAGPKGAVGAADDSAHVGTKYVVAGKDVVGKAADL